MNRPRPMHSDSINGARRWSRPLLWLAPPVLCVLAALVTSARGGMMIENGHATPMAWSELFAGALYDFSWWILIGPAIIWWVRRTWSLTSNGVALVAAHVFGAIGASGAYFILRAGVHLPGDRMTLGWRWSGFFSQFPSSVGLYALIASTAGLFLALTRARQREREASALALHMSRLETQLTEAQLSVLRAQLHPHFLFNALHAISTLIDWRPKEARQMLARLSELLRMALDLSEQREVTLARELEWLDHYLELQHARFGERLVANITVAGDAATALVPPLILQPLVENAIKHGIEPRREGGTIQVTAEREGRWLRLRVRDDSSAPLVTSARSGVGLRNTRDRLRTLYAEEQQTVLRKLDDGTTEAMIELPWRSAHDATAVAERAG
jgi:two-component system LytT family sensor kinase